MILIHVASPLPQGESSVKHPNFRPLSVEGLTVTGVPYQTPHLQSSYCAFLGWAGPKLEEETASDALPRPLSYSPVFPLGTGTLCLPLPGSRAVAGYPWAVPSQEEQPSGAKVWLSELLREAGRPLLLPILLPLGTFSAKNKLSENHIFLC